MTTLSPTEKSTIYADALIVTLTDTAKIIGDPDINSALAALTFCQAYLIAKITDRNVRRVAERQIGDDLARMTAEQVNARIINETLQGSASK